MLDIRDQLYSLLTKEAKNPQLAQENRDQIFALNFYSTWSILQLNVYFFLFLREKEHSVW